VNSRLTPDARRWALCAALAVAAHAGLALAIPPRTDDEPGGDAVQAFVVELASLPTTRTDVPDNVAPGPDQTEAAAMPVPQKLNEEGRDADVMPAVSQDDVRLALPPVPDAEVVLPEQTIPAPRAEAAPLYQAPAPATTATQAIAPQVAETARAPEAGTAATDRALSPARWKARLERLLETNKRYPPEARARRQQGEVRVMFVLNRQGHLVSRRVVVSSGHLALDTEALALLDRTQPFPSLPKEWPGERISIAAPIRFNLR